MKGEQFVMNERDENVVRVRSPIQNRIGQVFVSVTDMDRSIIWYSRLLGLPVERASHGGMIYDIPTEGETRLALDAHKNERSTASHPLFFFWTSDIGAAENFLRRNGVEVLGEVQDIGSVAFLTFNDPDNNLLRVCQRKDEMASFRN